jgi:hypothetical protein
MAAFNNRQIVLFEMLDHEPQQTTGTINPIRTR